MPHEQCHRSGDTAPASGSLNHPIRPMTRRIDVTHALAPACIAVGYEVVGHRYVAAALDQERATAE